MSVADARAALYFEHFRGAVGLISRYSILVRGAL